MWIRSLGSCVVAAELVAHLLQGHAKVVVALWNPTSVVDARPSVSVEEHQLFVVSREEDIFNLPANSLKLLAMEKHTQ